MEDNPSDLDLLEELLGMTEQFKDLLDSRYRDRWLAISAEEADRREAMKPRTSLVGSCPRCGASHAVETICHSCGYRFSGTPQ